MTITLENIQGEERDGFYVQPIMKRAWMVELDVMKAIDRICRRHHIRYWGWYGTLLGAVRHQGFIPWDDDMDLAMLREDYERFQYYAALELPEGWRVFRNGPGLICVKNADKVWINQEFLDRYHGCPYAVGVDIFCLDRIPCEEEEQKLQMYLCQGVYGLWKNWDSEDGAECWERKDRWSCLREVQELTGYHIDIQGEIKEQLYDLGDKIAAMYWDAECEEVSFVPWARESAYVRIPISCFRKTRELPFENIGIPVVENYDQVLRILYGKDYMIPQKAYEHDYPVFQNQIEELRKFFSKHGEPFPEFFDMKDEEWRE